MREDDFLQAILANPKDDAALLIYSDWLDEQGDPTSAAKAEFLSLMAPPSGGPPRNGGKKARKRMQQLAASLDTGWLAVVSRLTVENCPIRRNEGEPWPRTSVFQFRCERRWEDLQPTDDREVRFCRACSLSVYYCDTIMEVRQHAGQGHCVAVDLGIIRREGDLANPEPDRISVGRPSPESIRREQERLLPDPVSVERERRKQKAREDFEKYLAAVPDVEPPEHDRLD
jgi:uncharacterized protein (TIGR02996 family)